MNNQSDVVEIFLHKFKKYIFSELKDFFQIQKCHAFNKNGKKCCHMSQPNSLVCSKHKNYIVHQRSFIDYNVIHHNHIFEVGGFHDDCPLCNFKKNSTQTVAIYS